MKKVKKSRKMSKPLATVAILVAIGVLLTCGLYSYQLLQTDKNSAQSRNDADERTVKTDLDQPTKEQIKAGESVKEETLKDTPQSTTPTDPSFIITAKNINTSSSTLQIRTLLSEVVSKGTCTLKLTKGSSVITRTVVLQAGPADSTCQGFDIPLSELSNGTWSISITAQTPSINKTTEDKVDVTSI